jgi:tetratricopeptide (TPR) repeat protein/ABC-type oligopeptide transport system ATPase subunit
MITNDTMSDGESIRYNSITSLKAAHTKLLKSYKDDENDEANLDEIEWFVRAAAGTGALLDNDNDRYGVQGLIDYWVTILYRGKRTPPDATLVEFDPLLSPILDDNLCPYRGLNAFQEADRDVFFGRHRLLDVLLKKITTTQVLFVVGSSGSGKSSLVLAALIPALKNDRIPGAGNWQYIPSFVPGSDPLRSLASALGNLYQQPHEWVAQQVEQMKQDSNHLTKLVASFSHEPAVVVIDQFEELFTLCLDDSLRAVFIDNLLSLTTASAARNEVILTLRTDYETYLAQNPELMALFEEGQVRVMPLTAAELRSAIEEPAKNIDLRFEEGVVDSLVKDILGEPEGLPLLQFTLLRLWKARENGRNRITLNEYRKLGGARRALALTADEFYQNLTDANRITLRRIMLRLALPSGTAEVLRNTVKREALYFEDPRRVNDVLDQLADEGLIRVTKTDDRKDDKIEIAHEALVRHWPTLVGWIEKERVTMRQRLRLTSAAQQWLEHGKDKGGLLGGSLLAEARQYEALNDLEKEFVAASLAAVNRAEQQKEEERRLKQVRLRQFVSVLTVLLIVALGAAVFGLFQARQARANERRAKEQAILAQSNYKEAVKQTNIAQKLQKEAQNSKEEMQKALQKATKAEALAKTESEKARIEAKRAILARNDANKYSALYRTLLSEKEKELELRQQELELRKQRDEANANLKRERVDAAIPLYEGLLEKYKAANDFRGQAEIHSQLSRAYYLAAEKAERKRDNATAERNHQKSVSEYENARNIIETESKKDIEAAKDDKGKVFLILWEKAQFFRDHSKAADAEKVYLEAMALQEGALTQNDSLKEENYDNLAENLIDLYREQPAKLEALYRRVLEKKRLLHPVTESPEIYQRLRELAGFYRSQNRLAEVEKLYQEALSIVQQVIKKENSENEPVMLGYLVDSLTDLAKTYQDKGIASEAEKYYRQALEKQRQKVGLEQKGNELLTEIETALAKTLKEQKKYSESLNLYGEAVKRSAAQKSVNPKTLTASLDAISEILQEQGQSEKIEQSYQETLSAFSNDEAVKKSIPESLMSQASNQYKAAAQQTPREAIKSFRVAERLIGLAFSASKTVPNTTNESFQLALNTLLESRFAGGAEGDTAETENFLKNLLEMKLESSIKRDRRGLRSADQVISAIERYYRNRDELKLATIYQSALTIRTNLYNGTDNQSVYTTHNDLGKLYLRLGRYEEAKTNYRISLAIVERVFKKGSAGLVVDSLLNLALAHVAVKEYTEAEQLYLRAESNLESNKGDKTLKMAEVLTAYAGVLEKTARLPKANKLLKDAQEIRSKLSAASKTSLEKE